MISGQTMGIISLTRHLETIIIMQARGTWYTISRSRVQGSGFRFFVHRCPYDEIMEKNEGKRRVHGKLWLWITCHTLGCTIAHYVSPRLWMLLWRGCSSLCPLYPRGSHSVSGNVTWLRRKNTQNFHTCHCSSKCLCAAENKIFLYISGAVNV